MDRFQIGFVTLTAQLSLLPTPESSNQANSNATESLSYPVTQELPWLQWCTVTLYLLIFTLYFYQNNAKSTCLLTWPNPIHTQTSFLNLHWHLAQQVQTGSRYQCCSLHNISVTEWNIAFMNHTEDTGTWLGNKVEDCDYRIQGSTRLLKCIYLSAAPKSTRKLSTVV